MTSTTATTEAMIGVRNAFQPVFLSGFLSVDSSSGFCCVGCFADCCAGRDVGCCAVCCVFGARCWNCCGDCGCSSEDHGKHYKLTLKAFREMEA